MDQQLRKIINRCLASLITLLFCGHLNASPNWALQPDCSLLSTEKTINDGYQETPVRLQINDTQLRILTESNIDIQKPATGVSVDKGELISANGLEKDTVLVFSENISRITEQFIAGNSVEVHLHFWPTWPDTGQKTVRFSLLGFTREHRLKETCN